MSLTVEEMRQKVVDMHLMTKEEAAATRKGKLREVLENGANDEIDEDNLLEEDNDILNDLVEEEVAEVDNNNYIPERGSVDWESYVLDQFEPHEMEEDCPKINGLRRLTEKLIGIIVSSGPKQVFPSRDEYTFGKASVVYEVKIQPHAYIGPISFTDDEIRNGEIPQKVLTYSALATSWEGNVTSNTFKNFMEAVAETRAEARALKKALGINIVSKEERDGSMTERGSEFISGTSPEDDDGMITNIQKKRISIMTMRLGIHPDKLVEYMYKDSEGYKTVDELSKQEGADVIKEINKYQTNTEQSLEIPEEIRAKGYADEN